MASLFGPEEFIVNLFLLLLIMIMAIVVFDRLLRRRRGSNIHWQREAKGIKGTAVTSHDARSDRSGSKRLSRNYLDSGGAPGGTEQERTFSHLYKQSNDALNEEPDSPTTAALMKKMDDQYIRMLSFFEGQDRGSTLHMEHNYLWLKFRQMAGENPNGAFISLTQSLAKLLERQGAKPYEPHEFATLMDRYQGTMGDLHRSKGFNVNTATVSFFSFSARLNIMFRSHPDPAAKEAVGKVMVEFVRLLLEEHYLRVVQSHYLQELKVEQIQSITDQVEGLMRAQEGTGRADPQVQMVCNYLVCRLRMAQLRAMAMLEPSPGRPQEMHEAHMRKLANDSILSGSECVKWAQAISDKGDRTMLAQVEIVHLLATHFQTTYGKRSVIESWNTMSAIRDQVRRSTIEEGIPLAEELLVSCDEEWRVLNASTKEWLARQTQLSPTDYEGGAAEGGIMGLRRLSFMQENGIPSDTFVKVLEAIKRERPGKKSWPKEGYDTMKALVSRGSVIKKIDLPGSPYLCLIIGAHHGIIVKTGDDRIEAGPIMMAVESLHKAGVMNNTVCVNFNNELVTAEMLRRFLPLARKRYPGTEFRVVDTVQFITGRVTCLRQMGSAERFALSPDLYL